MFHHYPGGSDSTLRHNSEALCWRGPMNCFASKVRKMSQLFGATAAIFVMSISVFAQINTGRILGAVTDQSGGVIAGAMVAVTNVDTGVARSLVADDAGEFFAPNLNAGKYLVRVSAPGFQAFERQNIELEVGKDARTDAQLTPGQITQTVTVSESIPLLDATSAKVTGT